MHNLVRSGRGLWVDVLLFAAVLSLCAVAEAQNQRSNGPARRASGPPSASRAIPKASNGSATGANNNKKEARPSRGASVPGSGASATGGRPAAGPGGIGRGPRPASVPASNNEEDATDADVAEDDETNKNGDDPVSVSDLKNAETNGETSSDEELKGGASEKEEENAEEIVEEVKSSGKNEKFRENDEKYSTEPLDLQATKLPPMYRGHDFAVVGRKVAALFSDENVEKDEYEKTADFKERIEKFRAELPEQPLYGNLKFGSPLALALLPNEDGFLGVSSSYDADLEAFNIVFNDGVDYRVYGGDERLYGVKFEELVTSSETYTAKNGFGVEKTVKKSRFISRGVVYTDSLALALDENETLRLSGIAPSDARKIGDSLAVLCVFDLYCVDEMEHGVATPNCDVYGVWSCEPTMSRPYDFFEVQIAARVSIPRFWIYNFETGEVYAKYTLKDLKSGRSKTIGSFTLEDETTAKKTDKESVPQETDEEKVKRETAEKGAKDRRSAARLFQNGERSRIAAAKKLRPSREGAASATFNVPKDCATLKEAIDKANEEFEKKPNTGPLPRVVLEAGEYDASGLTLKTFVDIQSASGNVEDVILNVDATNPITVDGELVAEFDGVTLRQIGDAKTGTIVDVKRGIAAFFNCALDGQMGAKSATGVKATGLKSAAVLQKCRSTGFSLTALHVEDGAFGWATESVWGPKNRFGASSKGARLEIETSEFNGNETGVYFGRNASGGASGNKYADNKRDAQIVDGAKVEVDAPNVEEK